MTHATTVVMDLDRSKLAAHAIKNRFDELNSPIKLNHAYEALAIAHRHPNWATMKAALAAPHAMPSGTSDDIFSVGVCLRFEGSKQVEDQVSVSWKEALNHIHGFSTSHEARHNLLRDLSANAMKSGGTSVFVEPVSDAETKSRLINRLLRHATANGRRDDFFVLDLSVEGSRMGNTCNMLDAMSPTDVVEFLLHGFLEQQPDSDQIDDARLTLSHCATKILQHKVHGEISERITIEALCRELEVLEKQGYLKEILNDAGPLLVSISVGGDVVRESASFSAATSGLPVRLIKHLRGFSLKHHRLLDGGSHWRGFGDVLTRPQTLLIFIDDGCTPFTALLSRVVIDALRTVIEFAHVKTDNPNMFLLNDIDFLRNGIAERATQNGICLVIADQCPTPPRHLVSAPISFRSETIKKNSETYFHHELVTSKGERIILPGRVRKADSE